MKTLALVFDPATGNLTTPSGYHLMRYTVNGREYQELMELEELNSKSSITELVAAGLNADDLIKLKHGGVL